MLPVLIVPVIRLKMKTNFKAYHSQKLMDF